MKNLNLVEGPTEYNFADRNEWDDDRLRVVAAGLLRFLKQHVPTQTVPEEILFDADQALENATFEGIMRRKE